MKILGIETSCDETAAAIVEDGKKLLTNVVASSAEIHRKYGGIVPEVAARKQVESIIPVLTEAMVGYIKDDIDAIAVTVGPGLIGSLLVGVETAKTLAYVWNKPVIPVNHVLAHIYAVFLKNEKDKSPSWRESREAGRPIGSPSLQGDSIASERTVRYIPLLQNDRKIEFPAIALVVSGGHTELYLMNNEKTLKWLGGTLDDAAGECFDKCARLLGLPYPGGPEIAKRAEEYLLRHPKQSEGSRPNGRSSHARKIPRQARNDLVVIFPRPMIDDESLNFSFSGLKTAVLREWKKYSVQRPTTNNQQFISIFAHEIQEAITDVLVAKTFHAAIEYKVRSIIVTGGVAANIRLTQKFLSRIQSLQPTTNNLQLFVPPPNLCVDSASFIAAYAFYHNNPVDWKYIDAKPDVTVEVNLA